MKKVISVLLPMIMGILLLFPLAISADNGTSAKLKVSGVVYPGNTVTIALNVTGKQVAGITGSAISKGYDSSKMELVSTPTTSVGRWTYESGKEKFMLQEFSTNTYDLTNKDVLKMTFQINKNARIGDKIIFKISGLEVVAKENLKKDLILELPIVERPKETNNKLESLSVEGFEFSPKFDPNVTEYHITCHNKYTEMKVNAKAQSARATLKIEGDHDFQVGENNVKITVTAENGVEKVYTIKVTRKEPPSTNPNLSSVVIKEGTLEPAFSPDITEYKLQVASDVLKATFEIQTEDAHAKFQIAGNEDFKVGENRVTVLVTAEDEATTKIYTFVISRKRPIETDPKASSLLFPDYTITPEFDNSKEQEYFLTIPYVVENMANLKVTTVSAYATYKVENGENLLVGENTVKIIVTAEDGTSTCTYILKVTREPRILNSNTFFSSLTTDNGGLVPEFSSENRVYTMVSTPGLSSIALSAVAADPAAKATSGVFPLKTGLNIITLPCTAENGTVENYTVYVFVPEKILKLTGSPKVGEQLKADYNGSSSVGTYTWYVGDVVLSGVNGDTCTLMPDHAGKSIRVVYKDENGTVESEALYIPEVEVPEETTGATKAELVILITSVVASLILGGGIGFFFTKRRYR